MNDVPEHIDERPESNNAAPQQQHQQAQRQTLADLPPELILEILCHLPTSSSIALKLTSKRLFAATPAPPTAWTSSANQCDRRAANRYVYERKDMQAGKRQCLICNLVAPFDRYASDVPICKWHDAWFRSASIPAHLDALTQLRLHNAAKVRAGAFWVPVDRTFCLHEKDIVAWHVPDCFCDCASCGHFPVTCYVRVSGKRDAPTHAQPTDGGRWMSEEHWMMSE